MNKALIAIAVLSMSFTSCKKDKTALLARKWQEVSVVNVQQEQMMQDEMHYLDTVGTHTDAATNIQLYGTANLDSMKRNGKASMERIRGEQEAVTKATWFLFEKNGTLITHSLRGTDTSSWTLGKDNILTMRKKGGPQSKQLKIEHLSDTALQLSTQTGAATYQVRFRPAGNE